MRTLMVMVLTLCGCKPNTSEYTFKQDYAEAFCDKSDVCQWSELPKDRQECIDLLVSALEEDSAYCTDFSTSNAKSCLSEIRRMTCDQGAKYQDTNQYPGSCAAVYDCYGYYSY